MAVVHGVERSGVVFGALVDTAPLNLVSPSAECDDGDIINPKSEPALNRAQVQVVAQNAADPLMGVCTPFLLRLSKRGRARIVHGEGQHHRVHVVVAQRGSCNDAILGFHLRPPCHARRVRQLNGSQNALQSGGAECLERLRALTPSNRQQQHRQPPVSPPHPAGRHTSHASEIALDRTSGFEANPASSSA